MASGSGLSPRSKHLAGRRRFPCGEVDEPTGGGGAGEVDENWGGEREDKAEQEGGEEADRGDKVWGEAVHKLEHWDRVQGWLGGRGRG